jgi:hypothetical protein
MGVHHWTQRQRCSSRTREQGQDRRTEGTVQAQGHLGPSGSSSDGVLGARARTLQPRDRQQASRLRPRQLMVRAICHGDQMATRAVVIKHKTQRPVQFEITQATRGAAQKWIKLAGLKADDFLFPSRIHDSPHLGTRRYARILEGWGRGAWPRHSRLRDALDAANQGDDDLPTHEQPACRAVAAWPLRPGLESTARYLGIEVDDDLKISGQTEI